MNCKTFQNQIPDLLLHASDASDPQFAAHLAHLRVCPPCEREYFDLKATFGLLDLWRAPGPSPYFDQKLSVRIREEQAAPAMGWFERLQTRLLLNTGRQFRPALAGALVLVLLVGGGTVAELNVAMHPNQPSISAAVDDLQILDRNEQAFQQMDQLLQDDDAGGSSAPAKTTSDQPII